jgi:hypothetical protein
MMPLLRRIAALIASAGILSCGVAAAGWQSLTLPKIGELRLRHPHTLTPADTAPAGTTAQTLIDWTRASEWDRLRVIVDDKHPLVIQFKAGSLLVLTPSDATLPIIWLSLEPDHGALLEDRATGGLSIHDRPPGKSLNLHWLGL